MQKRRDDNLQDLKKNTGFSPQRHYSIYKQNLTQVRTEENKFVWLHKHVYLPGKDEDVLQFLLGASH